MDEDSKLDEVIEHLSKISRKSVQVEQNTRLILLIILILLFISSITALILWYKFM